MAKVQTSLL